MRLRHWLLSAAVLLCLAAGAPMASAECIGDCNDCAWDEFGTPWCAYTDGTGYCSCRISYIAGSCSGYNRCHQGCPWWDPQCRVAKCDPSGTPAWATEAPSGREGAFQPYYRTIAAPTSTLGVSNSSGD